MEHPDTELLLLHNNHVVLRGTRIEGVIWLLENTPYTPEEALTNQGYSFIPADDVSAG